MAFDPLTNSYTSGQERARRAIAALPANLARLPYAELPRYEALLIGFGPDRGGLERFYSVPWTEALRAKADAVLAEADTRPERAVYTGRTFLQAAA